MPQVYAAVYVTAFVVAAFGAQVFVHASEHGAVVPAQAAAALFVAINALICVWEVSLFVHRAEVRRQYAALRRRYKRRLPPGVALFDTVTLSQALSLKHWAVIWSTYSLLDDSYSDPKSFGFWIDTGNGISMLVPTVLLGVGMTYDVLPARALGALGLVANWQMLYGTVLYFSQYCLNERYKGWGKTEVGIVIVANGIWIAFPAHIMLCCWRLIESGTFDAFRAGGYPL